MDPEYFINQIYIKDLQKLKDEELYFIIRLFRDELEYFNQFDGFKLQGLIKACDEMKDLIKNIRFILNGYVKLMTKNNNNIPLESQTDIEELWSVMNNIENYLNRIKAIRLLKTKVNELVDICLLKMRMHYDLLSDFTFMEEHLWETCSTLE